MCTWGLHLSTLSCLSVSSVLRPRLSLLRGSGFLNVWHDEQGQMVFCCSVKGKLGWIMQRHERARVEWSSPYFGSEGLLWINTMIVILLCVCVCVYMKYKGGQIMQTFWLYWDFHGTIICCDWIGHIISFLLKMRKEFLLDALIPFAVVKHHN